MINHNNKEFYSGYEITRFMNDRINDDFAELNDLFRKVYKLGEYQELDVNFVTQKLYAAKSKNMISFIEYKKKTERIYFAFTVDAVKKFLGRMEAVHILSVDKQVLKEVDND